LSPVVWTGVGGGPTTRRGCGAFRAGEVVFLFWRLVTETKVDYKTRKLFTLSIMITRGVSSVNHVTSLMSISAPILRNQDRVK
jgi:hypothetical protein